MLRRTPLKSSRRPLRKKSRNPKHKAWKLFSEYIRQRDADEKGVVFCISCETPFFWRYVDAGHFIPASLSLALRFDERNVNGQCKGCNKWANGSIHKYTIGLRKKYGPEIVEQLEEARKLGMGLKLYASDYQELIEKYSAKLASMDAARAGVLK